MVNPLASICKQIRLSPEILSRELGVKLDDVLAALSDEPEGPLAVHIRIIDDLGLKYIMPIRPMVLTIKAAALDKLADDDDWRDQVGMKRYPDDPLDRRRLVCQPEQMPHAEYCRRLCMEHIMVAINPLDPAGVVAWTMQTEYRDDLVVTRAEKMPLCIRDMMAINLRDKGWLRSEDWKIDDVEAALLRKVPERQMFAWDKFMLRVLSDLGAFSHDTGRGRHHAAAHITSMKLSVTQVNASVKRLSEAGLIEVGTKIHGIWLTAEGRKIA